MQARSRAPRREPLPYLRHRHTRWLPLRLALESFFHWLTERPAPGRATARSHATGVASSAPSRLE